MLLAGWQEGHLACKKTGVVICLEWDADLHMAQLMTLPLTVSCFSKLQIGFTFLVPAYPGSPGQRAVKRVCVCVVHCLEKRQKCQNFKILAVKLYWSRIAAVICGVGVVGFLCFPFNIDLNLWNCELGTVVWVRTRLTPLIGQCVGDRIVSVSDSV